MVIDLRALGTLDFGHLWIFRAALMTKSATPVTHDNLITDNENNTLNDRLHPNLKSDCMTLIRFLAHG
jgi:hypothetical protein